LPLHYTARGQQLRNPAFHVLLPTLDAMVTEGLVALEKMNASMYRHNAAGPGGRTKDARSFATPN
jgi:hypothetical protein